MSKSVFAKAHDEVWAYRFQCTIEVVHMSGGVPNDPAIISGWLKSRLALDSHKKEVRDEELAALVERTAQERGVSFDEAIGMSDINVNGFKRDKEGLYFEGRCLKAMIKEGFSVALAGGHIQPRGWGTTNKGLLGFVAEHVQVPEDVVPQFREDGTRYTKPDRIEQRFVSTWRGQGISYSETLDIAVMTFTVESDYDFGDATWEKMWVVVENIGVGAMRSQGSGRFVVTQWDPIERPTRRRKAAS